MTYMENKIAEIEDMLLDGYSARDVSEFMGIPMEDVEAVMESFAVVEDTDDDFYDDDSQEIAQVLASAGWGTNEDYSDLWN